MSLRKKTEVKKFTLTIPVELLEKVKERANQQGKSLNQYILSVISQKIKTI